jgi:ATP-binding cassette subfamily B protein
LRDFFATGTIRMRERSIMVLQRRLLTLATNVPGLQHFERPDFWDRVQLLKQSAHDLVMGLSSAFLGPLLVGQLLVASGLLASVQPALLLVPFLAIPAAWLNGRAESPHQKADIRTAEKRRTTHHLADLATNARAAAEIRLYGLQSELLDRHQRASQDVHRIVESALLRAAAIKAIGWLCFALVYGIAIVVVVLEAIAGRTTPGDVALTLGLVTAVVAASSQVSSLAGSLLRVRTTVEHYQWLESSVAHKRSGVPPPVRLHTGIELVQVTFSYAGSERPPLVDVSLQLPAGSVVPLVGENGAGKTTLVKLLCGMYEPTKGRVLLEGIDLTTVDLEECRRRITAGFQDFMRFELPIRETVGIADTSRIHDEEAAQAALAKARADFVERLPAGLDTMLGTAWEGGVELSGGEWQKLALARTFFRTRPLLTVLDEPTASLDPQTEHAHFEQIAAEHRAAEGNQITLLISHRFSTVRMADLIVVLDRGRVIEQGSHADLVSRGGLYAELYELQSQAYR